MPMLSLHDPFLYVLCISGIQADTLSGTELSDLGDPSFRGVVAFVEEIHGGIEYRQLDTKTLAEFFGALRLPCALLTGFRLRIPLVWVMGFPLWELESVETKVCKKVRLTVFAQSDIDVLQSRHLVAFEHDVSQTLLQENQPGVANPSQWKTNALCDRDYDVVRLAHARS